MRTLMDILDEMDLYEENIDKMDLVEEGILDSYSLVALVGEINAEYKITIPLWEITPDNFRTIESIETLINKQKEK
ncbi:MAG: acyl carrier protein [Lachnospiraceae bacterium]|nr:acyl carrier protein [Lachnospiraceae bacterium]